MKADWKFVFKITIIFFNVITGLFLLPCVASADWVTATDQICEHGIIHDGKFYAGSDGLYVIDPEDGTILYHYGSAYITTAPVVDNTGYIYAYNMYGGTNGSLIKYQEGIGEIAYVDLLGSGSVLPDYESLVYDSANDQVITFTAKGLAAYHCSDMSEAWNVAMNMTGGQAEVPVIHGGYVYAIANGDGDVYKINIANGNVDNKITLPGTGNTYTSIIYDEGNGVIYVPCKLEHKNRVYALYVTDLSEAWHIELPGTDYAMQRSMNYHDNLLYVIESTASAQAYLYCYHTTDQSLKWMSTYAADNDCDYVGSFLDDNYVYVNMRQYLNPFTFNKFVLIDINNGCVYTSYPLLGGPACCIPTVYDGSVIFGLYTRYAYQSLKITDNTDRTDLPWKYDDDHDGYIGNRLDGNFVARANYLDEPYKAEISINNSPERDSFQCFLTIPYRPGMQANFDDLRFTDQEGYIATYWIEPDLTTNGVQAGVWIKLPEGSTSATMYYGNSTFARFSNGDLVFDLFDDFTDYDSNKWYNCPTSDPDGYTITADGTLTVASQNTETAGLISRYYVGDDAEAVRAYIKFPHGNDNSYSELIGIGDIDFTNDDSCVYFDRYGAGSGLYSAYGDNYGFIGLDTTDLANKWITTEIIDTGTRYTAIVDGTSIDLVDGYGSGINKKACIETQYDGAVIKCDWILMRKYQSMMPTLALSATTLNIDASFHASATTTLNGAINFYDDSTGYHIDTWQWNFGDDTANSTDQNPVHNYTKSGTFTVTLTIHDAMGLENTTQKVRYITVQDPAVSFVGTPAFGPPPLEVSFVSNVSGLVDYYSWSFGDMQTSTETNPSHTYSSDGAYKVNLTAGNAGGNSTMSMTITVVRQYIISLSQGWNLISIPVNNTTFWASDLVNDSGLGVSMVSIYNNTTGVYTTYIKDAPSWRNVQLTPDRGYFIYCSKQSTFEVTGEPLPEHNISIYRGWNLIGWSSYSDINASTIMGRVSLSMMSRYNNSTYRYQSYITGADQSRNFNLTAGQGYFLRSETSVVQQLQVG